MKQRIESLDRLALLRAGKVRDVQARLAHQADLCQRCRANIQALEQLAAASSGGASPLERDNAQRYKLTLHRALVWQRRELATFEQMRERLQAELQQARFDELRLAHVRDDQLAQWHQLQARQEQCQQDAMATQSWLRGRY